VVTSRPAPGTGRRSIQYLPYLHMPPLATVRGSDLSSVELSGDGIKACVAGRLDVPNDRQHVGSELRPACALRAAHMRFTAPAEQGVPSRPALAAARAGLGVPRSPRARVRHDDSRLLAAFEALPFSRQSAAALPALWRRLSQG
jgi:hypothetical protein